jgi:enoyl-CoA hydratase
MSDERVQYALRDGVATIRIDDGKRNALSPEILRGLSRAFARAETDGATVILTGRESVFSAGFDLKVMQRGGPKALNMLRLGYALTARIMAYPHPVIVACNGHCFAMGVFLMLSADHVIGSRGDFTISANEVAIGMTMPRVAAAALKQRLTPAAFQRAVTLSERFDVDSALRSGFFDETVEPAKLMRRAETLATELKELDAWAHRRSKRRIRRPTIRRIRFSLPLDLIDAVLTGMRRARRAQPS